MPLHLTVEDNYVKIVAYATVANATIQEINMQKFMKTLNNISRSQSVYRSERIKSEGLCGAHFSFALAICAHPGCSQEELARELCINKSTVTRALVHLQKHGYVTKKICETDKRQFSVYPTEKLLSVIDEIKDTSIQWMHLISEGITEQEMQVFYSVLSRMQEKAKMIINERTEEQ